MKTQGEKKEELRGLSSRLTAKGEEPISRSLEHIGRYQQLAEELNLGPAIDDAIVERANSLIKQGMLCEALLAYEKRLQTSPLEFSALSGWSNIRGRVHSEMIRLAAVSPECAEFGRTYEMLIEIGFVSNRLHIGAIRHYLSSGKTEKAAERLLALSKTAPGAPGIAELVSRLAQLSDNVQIQKMNLKLREVA